MILCSGYRAMNLDIRLPIGMLFTLPLARERRDTSCVRPESALEVR